VECNPEDATDALFAVWRAAGVNRVSFGVQSMVPMSWPDWDGAMTPTRSRSGPVAGRRRRRTVVNVDLIFGGAGETDDDFRRSLDAVLALEPIPGHVSAYALTVEPGTPLAADPARHPDDDVQARRYVVADDVLGRRLPVVRGVELGPSRPPLPPQPALLEPG
jgi:coproporphyrinogen III oxidase-like Fe-S oxidoreductase